MFALTQRLLLTFALFFAAGNLQADPLPDNSFKTNKAGWYASLATPCNQICRENLAAAEFERYASDTTKITHVCKVKARNARGELYGNNFYDNGTLKRQCIVVDHLGKVYRDRQFKCLCVKARTGRPVITNPPRAEIEPDL